jgi:hypothetical protein
VIRISIASEGFVVKATLPVGSTAYEAEVNAKGEVHIWLEPRYYGAAARARATAT